jgi:hypothetical protein
MATWAAFEAADPAMAARGRELLYQFGPGLAYLATVRRDGGPRVHPICPHLFEGRLYAFVGRSTPKHADLVRDGRYALHSFPCPEVDDEFYVTGTATPVADSELEARIGATLPFDSDGDDPPFELALERALLSTYGPRPSFPPEYRRWSSA